MIHDTSCIVNDIKVVLSEEDNTEFLCLKIISKEACYEEGIS